MKLVFYVTTDEDEGMTDPDYVTLPDGGSMDGDLTEKIIEAVSTHWEWAESK